jgi:hypothetical protein
MINKLGACCDPDKLKPNFMCPESHQNIHVLLDNCHMIKLVRNTFSDYGRILDVDGNVIEWKFIVFLYELQTSEKFHLANHITQEHIFWHNKKMNVRLAAQIFSRSTANAIDFCREQLKLSQFQGSEPTTKFLRIFDEVFDLLNSKSKFGNWAKAPLMESNIGYWGDVFASTELYITNLKDAGGRRLVDGRRKTGFIGFLLNMKSVQGIFESFVKNGKLEYILTFKLSQDHLESFFGCIRGRLGCNTNPTVPQFVSAYKKLLLGAKGKNFKLGTNILAQDSTECLTVFPSNQTSVNYCSKKFELNLEDEFESLDLVPILTDVQMSSVEYIAGYVQRQVLKQTCCSSCSEAVRTSEKTGCVSSLISVKDRGSLIYPSVDILKLCEISERKIVETTIYNKLYSNKNLLEYLCIKILVCCTTQYPNILQSANHVPSHKYNIIRKTVLLYCTIRLKYFAKVKNLSMKKNGLRTKLSKLILFNKL